MDDDDWRESTTMQRGSILVGHFSFVFFAAMTMANRQRLQLKQALFQIVQ